MTDNLLTYLISNDFINLKKVRKFIDNNLIEQFLNFKYEDKNYKFCNHLFKKGNYKGSYCFAKTFNSYTDKCKIHNKEYKKYKKNNIQDMNEFINSFNQYYDTINEDYISNESNDKSRSLELIINKIQDKIDSPPTYEQKPDETGKSIINEINNSNDISKPMFNNNIIKIGKKRRSKKNIITNNKIFTNEIINIDYNKIFNEVKLYKKDESLNINENKYNIIICNKELEEQYTEISRFMTKFDFLSPLVINSNDSDPHVIDVIDKKEYTNKLLNLKLTDYPNFRGKDIQQIARNIVTFQYKAYSYSLFNKPILTKNVMNCINQFISRIPK